MNIINRDSFNPTWDLTCGCFIWNWGQPEAVIQYIKDCDNPIASRTSNVQLVCKQRSDTDTGTSYQPVASVCEKLLEQFVIASPGDSKTPVETYQMTVDEICSAVNTDVKIKSSAILNSLDTTRKLYIAIRHACENLSFYLIPFTLHTFEHSRCYKLLSDKLWIMC